MFEEANTWREGGASTSTNSPPFRSASNGRHIHTTHATELLLLAALTLVGALGEPTGQGRLTY